MSHTENAESAEETTLFVQEINLDLFSVNALSSSDQRERA